MLEVTYKYLADALADRPEDEREALLMEGTRAAIGFLAEEFTMDCCPNELASELFRSVKEVTGVADPWKPIRDQSNHACLPLAAALRDQVRSGDSRTQLENALHFALAGNSIDFGTAGHEPDLAAASLELIYQENRENGFAIDHVDHLVEDLRDYGRCLFLLDNAGEIVFDKVLAAVLVEEFGVDLTAVVKGGPISNDAVMADAEAVNFQEVCPVIDTGSDDLGFDPANAAVEVLEILRDAPLVIAKGQANWECVYTYQGLFSPEKTWYCVFRAKCETHAELLGVPNQSNLVYRVPHPE